MSDAPCDVPTPVTRDVLTIPEFCERNGISGGTYYNLKQRGLGPRVMHVAGRRLITLEAEAEWRKACEK